MSSGSGLVLSPESSSSKNSSEPLCCCISSSSCSILSESSESTAKSTGIGNGRVFTASVLSVASDAAVEPSVFFSSALILDSSILFLVGESASANVKSWLFAAFMVSSSVSGSTVFCSETSSSLSVFSGTFSAQEVAIVTAVTIVTSSWSVDSTFVSIVS